LILGGENCQLRAFKLARARGVCADALRLSGCPPAARLADIHLRVSTFDRRRACLKKARGLRPDGIMTVGTDQPVFTCAWAAAKLGLPSLLHPATALAVTDKARMKQPLSENGIPTARWFLAGKRQLPGLPLEGPVVLKPVDNQGQRGIILAENIREAQIFLTRRWPFPGVTSCCARNITLRTKSR
jgi:hypothetical protein